MWRKGNPLALLVGMKIGAVTVESNMKIPKEIKSGSAFGPSNPTSRCISKGTQNTNLKNTCTPVFTAVLFTIAKIWKQPKCLSVGEWIKKLWYIYTLKF